MECNDCYDSNGNYIPTYTSNYYTQYPQTAQSQTLGAQRQTAGLIPTGAWIGFFLGVGVTLLVVTVSGRKLLLSLAGYSASKVESMAAELKRKAEKERKRKEALEKSQS